MPTHTSRLVEHVFDYYGREALLHWLGAPLADDFEEPDESTP
jgi:hypothetical protein